MRCRTQILILFRLMWGHCMEPGCLVRALMLLVLRPLRRLLRSLNICSCNMGASALEAWEGSPLKNKWKSYLNVHAKEHTQLSSVELSSDFQPDWLKTMPFCLPLMSILQLFQSYELFFHRMAPPLWAEGDLQGHDRKHFCEVARCNALHALLPHFPGECWEKKHLGSACR